MQNAPIHPQEYKPAQPLGRLITPNKTEYQTVNYNKTWTVEYWNLTGERGRGKELISAPNYQ
jgi:hypothetical protein